MEKINAKLVSPLSWVGGKAKQYKIISNLFPKEIETFVDVFLGGGSVLLNAINNNVAKKYIGNDIYEDLIEFYNGLKTETFNVEIPKTLLLAKEQYDKQPKWLQFWFNNTLNFGGFNIGKWSQGRLEQNFTIGKIKRLSISKELLNSADTNLYNKDYIEILNQTNKGDFVFLDPPYFYNQKTKVYKHTNLDFEEFKKSVDKLNKKGIKFLITIDNSPQIREMFKEYKFFEYEWKYSSTNAGKKENTKIGKELFIKNY